MIEDKDVKISENPEETLWFRVVDNLKRDIKQHEDTIKINRKFLEIAEKELEKANPKKKKDLNNSKG